MSNLNQEKVKATLAKIVDLFEAGNLPEAIAKTKLVDGKPSSKWSLLNRLIMLWAGTTDARGYKQWQTVERHVKRGAKSFSILAPRIVTITETNGDGEQEETKALKGFLAVPVFRLEDTEGKDLPSLEPNDPPALMQVAERFGLAVKYSGYLFAYGSYKLVGEKGIDLMSHDAPVFWHELAHAAHDRISNGNVKAGQHWDQECVAELSAAVLAEIYGINWLKNSFDYISHYADREGMTASQACLKVITTTEKVLAEIINHRE